jgi:hypothetical protein
MDREDFIITVYCIVCDRYREIMDIQRLRTRGFAPALSDEEAITIDICGEYFGFDRDEAIYDYFRSHYAHFFPHLRERTSFVRQAADLWQVKTMIQQRLTVISGQIDDPFQLIDTMPLPVCVYTRAKRDRCFKPDADFGYCAAKEMHYYGFKLGLRIARSGMITHFVLLPARPHDVHLVDELLAGFQGVAIGDKGFIDAFHQAALAQKRAIELVTPLRKNMKPTTSVRVRRLCTKWRKRIETVGSHLTERFHIDNTRARDLWHYQNRLIRKVLSHTVAVFINLQLGRPPLDLDGLVTA